MSGKFVSVHDLFDEIEWCDEKPEDTDWLEAILDDMPDPILRCRHCKHRKEKGQCAIFKAVMGKDDFCSRATPSELFALMEAVRGRVQVLNVARARGDWDDRDADDLAVFKNVYEYLKVLDEE